MKRDALAFALHVEAAEASFLALDHAGMTSHIRAALGFAKTPLEKIRVREIEIDAAVAWNNMQKAIEIGISLLRSMGIRFPKKPNKLHVVAALLKTRIALVGKRVEDLEKLPEMTDPDKILAIRLMWKINHAAFVVNPGLYVMLALKAIRMFVAFGVTGQWLCFSHYGFILCGALGDVEKGYQFGELDQKMLTRFENSVNRADVNNAHNVLIRGWKEHLRDILPDLLENYRIGLENGELQMAGVSLYVYGLFSFLAGKELGGLTREMDEHYQMLAALEHEMSIYIQAMNRRMAANFMEASDDPCALTCEAFDEKEMLAYYQKENDLNALINYYFCKSILGCYFGRRPQALESLAREESHLKDLPSTAAHAIFAFYDSLTRLAIPPGASRSERRAVFKKVKANQKKLNKWAFHAPMNFMHKFYLVEAEWMRARGDGEAPEFYERAMALAHEHEYIHEEALANELYANYWLGRRKEKIARLYLTEAHYLYTRWGAGAKVLDLENKHPWLGPGCAAETRDDTDQTTNSSTLSLSTFLDMSTVMKALRAISSEIDLESLMTRMMKIILETAGARKGFLLRKSAGRIYVDAVADMDSADVKTFWSVRLDDFRDLCGEIVHYVVRTGENVVLHDASREGRFTRAPYILENRPKSILCTPLLRENKLAGVLYLENNLIPDAFTEDRIETLQILLAQAAISLENAELYKKSRFAEKQARESEAHFRDLFEQSNDAIFIHDFHGKLLDVNGRACEMLGRSRERLVDSPIKKVHAKGTFKKTLDAFEICREEGSVIFEAVFRKADQGKIDVEISARIIDPLKGLVQAVVRDVTERKRTWEMMIQNEKMMTVGGLAAGMAHEVNNPLGGILQNVQVMRKRLSGKMPKNRRTAEECGVGMDAIEAYMEKRGLMTMMDVILDAGARAKKIVDSMLDFSRASETRLTPCDLIEILDNSVHLAATDYDAKKKFDFRQIEIIREYEKTPEVMCERGKIQQVVLNILKNGAQAMAESRERGAPDDPTAPPRFILRARREKEMAVIEIEDNGPGMDEAVRKRIFDPFFTTKKAGVGTGLGLSVSYFIITENHGGVMEAASEPGEGATFIIKLPIGGASVPRGGEG
ncbi:MAG: PAS domain S-box protein [Desulfobacterales bacterium]|nr:PAS domain S-box protein [Desulfobacterales bacterium]